jgi:molybdate transport system regulatory protein
MPMQEASMNNGSSLSHVPDSPGHMLPVEQSVMRLHLWLENRNGTLFGLGRQKLLESIHSGMSLHAAAAQLGMSYRAAWGKIKKTEKALGFPLVLKKKGNRSGYHLTAEGEHMMICFRKWYAEVEQFALTSCRKIFPFPVSEYPDGYPADETPDSPSGQPSLFPRPEPSGQDITNPA